MKKQNLVFLVFTENPCYTEIVRKCPKEVKLNLESRTWKFNGSKYEIGKSRPLLGYSYGVIGVYDQTNLEHLNSMLNDFKEVVKVPSYSMD